MDIPSGERKTIVLCTSLLFAIVAAFIILKAARDALFLTEYSARTLPYFMGITTAVTAALAAIYIRLYKALSLGPAVELSLKVFAVGTLVLWAGIKAGWPVSTAVLYVWTGIYGALAPVQAWTVITQLLLTRQAKRALGIIGSGAIVGASAGGFLAKWVVQGSSVATLLPTAAILILLALFTTQALTALSWSNQPGFMESQGGKVSRRFIVLVLLVVSAGTVVTTFADFQFKVIAQREITTANELAEFFGSFYAYIGIATLLFQLLVTPTLMSKIGVSAALTFLPVALAIGNAWVLLAGSLSAAVFLKGGEQLFKHSVDRSSLEVVYMAIPEDVKVRLKSLIDAVGVRTAEGVAVVLLIGLYSLWQLPFQVLSAISLVLVGGTLFCAILLGREYPRALNGVIQQQDLNLSSVKSAFFTTDFYQVLPGLFETSRKETLLDLLELLRATGNKKLKPYLLPLLDHQDPDVRLQALQLLFTQEEDLSKRVENMVGDPDARVRVEAIKYLCFKTSIDPLEKLAHLLTDPEPTVQAAACACSLNLEIAPAQQMAYNMLETLMSDSTSKAGLQVRLEVAGILQHVNPSNSFDILGRRLLNDPELEVRRATLRSLGKIKPHGMIHDLLHLMNEPLLRNEVRQALAAYGSEIIPHLQYLLDNPGSTMETKKLALKILADIASKPAIELLFAHAVGPNLALRFTAIKSLNRLRKRQDLPLPRASLDSLLNQEITGVEVEFERAKMFSPKRGGLMEAVLSQRAMWARERVFRCLALLYEPKGIYNAYRAITGRDRRRAESAVEYLDTILLPDHRNRIIPMLESRRAYKAVQDAATRRAILFTYLGARDQLPAAALIADLDENELSTWKEDIAEAMQIFSDLPLVEETLNWRYQNMLPDSLRRKLTTIQKLEMLGKVDMFSELGPNELLLLANQCVEAEFDRDELIFAEGDPARDIFVLAEGSIELTRSTGLTNLIREGDSFGTLSVLGDQPRFFNARTLEHCLCLKIDRDTFWEILEDYPAICQGIFKVMALRFGSVIGPS